MEGQAKKQKEEPFDPLSYGTCSSLDDLYRIDRRKGSLEVTYDFEKKKEEIVEMLSRCKQEQTGDPNARFIEKHDIKCLSPEKK